jgi:hypothetical protein
MACYRCGTRQVDPARGHSPWRRGVRGNQQVLICPTCQCTHDWAADLDRCGRCGSVRLVRRLGEVECRECGFVVAPEGAAAVAGPGVSPAAPGRAAATAGVGAEETAEAPDLSEEVARALDRVLGRGTVRG